MDYAAVHSLNSSALEGQELYRVLVEELTDYAFFLLDEEGYIMSWNPGVERLLGYRTKEFIGQPMSILFTPEDTAQGVPERERNTARHQGRASDTRWHLRKDGSRLPVAGVLVARRNNQGEVIGFAKLMHDVSVQQRADEEQRAYAQQAKILESISDVFYAFDARFCFTYVNRRAEEWWGRSRASLLGRHYWTEFPGVVGSVSYHQHRSAMADRQPRHYETISALSQRWMSVSLYPEPSGGLSCYLQDITDRKQAEAEREQLLAALESSNEELAQFSSIVAHDLETPLRMVKSYAHLIRKRYAENLDATGQEFLRYVLDGAQAMEELIRGLLAYARGSDTSYRQTEVSLESVLTGVLATLQNTIEETGATITHDRLPTVQGDPLQFLQLFQNLIGNALKYCRPGVAPVVHLSIQEQKREWRFSVRDNGLGIDAKHTERIFLPLKRLHGGEISGVGIGLAICKKIVERRGGRIWVESEVGVGSTFVFTLPREPAG